jgi:hypothetical protein
LRFSTTILLVLHKEINHNVNYVVINKNTILQGFSTIYLSFFTTILLLLQTNNHVSSNQIIDMNIILQGFSATYLSFFTTIFLLPQTNNYSKPFAPKDHRQVKSGEICVCYLQIRVIRRRKERMGKKSGKIVCLDRLGESQDRATRCVSLAKLYPVPAVLLKHSVCFPSSASSQALVGLQNVGWAAFTALRKEIEAAFARSGTNGIEQGQGRL